MKEKNKEAKIKGSFIACIIIGILGPILSIVFAFSKNYILSKTWVFPGIYSALVLSFEALCGKLGGSYSFVFGFPEPQSDSERRWLLRLVVMNLFVLLCTFLLKRYIN